MVKTDSAGDIIEFIFIDNTLFFSKATDVFLNSLTAPPPDCNTALDISGWIPSVARVSGVLIGGHGDHFTTPTEMVIGYDGTNVFLYFTGTDGSAADDEQIAWGLRPFQSFMPLETTDIYWGDGVAANTQTGKLLLHAIRFIL